MNLPEREKKTNVKRKTHMPPLTGQSADANVAGVSGENTARNGSGVVGTNTSGNGVLVQGPLAFVLKAPTATPYLRQRRIMTLFLLLPN